MSLTNVQKVLADTNDNKSQHQQCSHYRMTWIGYIVVYYRILSLLHYRILYTIQVSVSGDRTHICFCPSDPTGSGTHDWPGSRTLAWRTPGGDWRDQSPRTARRMWLCSSRLISAPPSSRPAHQIPADEPDGLDTFAPGYVHVNDLYIIHKGMTKIIQ